MIWSETFLMFHRKLIDISVERFTVSKVPVISKERSWIFFIQSKNTNALLYTAEVVNQRACWRIANTDSEYVCSTCVMTVVLQLMFQDRKPEFSSEFFNYYKNAREKNVSGIFVNRYHFFTVQCYLPILSFKVCTGSFEPHFMPYSLVIYYTFL